MLKQTNCQPAGIAWGRAMMLNQMWHWRGIIELAAFCGGPATITKEEEEVARWEHQALT